jgi:nitric oxide reductase NorD protein
VSTDQGTDAAWRERLAAYRAQLDCRFPHIDEVFEACLRDALSALSPAGVSAYLESGRFLGRMGRGVEPVLVFLEEWPSIARLLGEDALPPLNHTLEVMAKSPNAKAITPFLQTLAAIARRLPAREQMQCYFDLALDLMERTSSSIHGIHKTFASPGLPDFFAQAPNLLNNLAIAGLKNWVDYGIRNYGNHPERQRAYFSLQSADSRAVFQRVRHGTLLLDHERRFDLYLRGLWGDSAQLVPYATGLDPATTAERAAPTLPYYDATGIRLPDVLDDAHGVSGIDRYRAILAHIAGHRRWSTPIFADNFSPMQRMAIEFFEDSRIEALVVRQYPGLRRIFLALHPEAGGKRLRPGNAPRACAIAWRCSRARCSTPRTAIRTPICSSSSSAFTRRWHTASRAARKSPRWRWPTSRVPAARATSWPSVHFTDTEVGYRDDNRHLWRFHELSDDEEMFDQPRPTTAVPKSTACRRAITRSGTIRARPIARTGSASTNRCTRRGTPR